MYSRNASTSPSIGFSYPVAIGHSYVGARHTADVATTRTPWDRIQEAMRDHGLKPTQKQCAAILGITQPSVWEWANGETAPSVENAIVLGRKLNVCVEWVLTGSGPKRPGPPMEPAAQALWDVWERIPAEERPLVVGYAEAKARPSHPSVTKRPKVAQTRRTGS